MLVRYFTSAYYEKYTHPSFSAQPQLRQRITIVITAGPKSMTSTRCLQFCFRRRERSIIKSFLVGSCRRCSANITKMFSASSDRVSTAVFSQHADNLVSLDEAHSMLKCLIRNVNRFIFFPLPTCIILTITTETRTQTLPDHNLKLDFFFIAKRQLKLFVLNCLQFDSK